MIRLVYQRGEFTPEQTTLVATALFWFAFSLPTNGLYLLQTRTFFSLQRPWMATGLAGLDLVVSALAALALYKPFGAGGIVAGTGIGTTARGRRPGGRSCAASSAASSCGGCSTTGLRITARRRRPSPPSASASGTSSTSALGRGLLGQIVSLGTGARRWAALVYLGAAQLLRIAELEQIMRLAAAAASDARPGRYLLGVAELALLAGFATLGAASALRRGCCPVRGPRRTWPRRCSRWRC